ncbi:TPA: carbohydrate porin [Raoultella ornithinolytica]|nr:carbohydrate porin [Raoultella ornithinolytica]
MRSFLYPTISALTLAIPFSSVAGEMTIENRLALLEKAFIQAQEKQISTERELRETKETLNTYKKFFDTPVANSAAPSANGVAAAPSANGVAAAPHAESVQPNTQTAHHEQKEVKAGDLTLSQISDYVKNDIGIESHGYMRTGWASTTNGAPTAWAAGSLGRFGNEYDGWYDLFMMKRLYEEDGKSVKAAFNLEGDLGLRRNGESFDRGYMGGGYGGITALYLSTKGFLPFAPEAEFWLGKNSPIKREVQMFDWKHYYTDGGSGVGINGWKLGSGELSLDIMRADVDNYKSYCFRFGQSCMDSSDYKTVNTNMFDIMYSKVPVFDNSTFDIHAKYAWANKTSEDKKLEGSGEYYNVKPSYQLLLAVNTPALGGNNEVSFQTANNSIASSYMNISGSTGMFEYASMYYGNHTNGTAYRLMNQGEIYLSDKVIMQDAIVYGWGEDLFSYNTGSHTDFNSLRMALRPSYIWDKNNQTGFEVGYFNQTNKVSGTSYDESGYKVTLAHTFKTDFSLLSRPEIRIYTTYLKALENEIDNHQFNDGKNYQVSFGVEGEVFW